MLVEENITRKVDSLGRIIIPKAIRQKMKLEEGEMLEYYTMQENGQTYLCLGRQGADKRRFIVAGKVLKELGLSIPKELAAEIASIGK